MNCGLQCGGGGGGQKGLEELVEWGRLEMAMRLKSRCHMHVVVHTGRA